MSRALTRRQILTAGAAAFAPAPLESRDVQLVLRVSDGEILSGRTPQAQAWLLPPGSTIKPFVLQALFDSGKLRPSETFLCPGKFFYRGHNLSCTHPAGLPPMDASRAIAFSCNNAVAHFGQRFSSGELTAALRRAGFRTTPADDTLQALGEQGVSITPLELATAYRRLAQHAHPAILDGLEGAVKYGTAQAASVSLATVAGKTGSAIAGNGLRAAWFAGFAPSRSPQIVVVVAAQGRSGGSDAAPLAQALFEKFLAPIYKVRIRDRIIELPVEQYVAAVLAGEASIFHNPEALKAMAVAARTFAAHERGRHAKEGFDFCNTTHCQRAEPDSIAPALTAASASTAGEVLRFKGELAFTPYTMNCAGTAESAEAVWPDLHAAYLRVHSDPFCDALPYSHQFAPQDIERALRDSGLKCPDHLTGIAVLNRTGSGRAHQLMLHGAQNEIVSAGAFRFAIGRTLGWNLVRSNFFDVSNGFSVHGKGEGHGVGLCQRGADRMAGQGHSYHEILAFYYPGTSGTEWQRLGGEGITVFSADPVRDRVVVSEAEQILKGLPWPLSSKIEIYVYPTLDAFRSATVEPAWVAAHTEGSRIDLQPVSVLQSRGVLRSTLKHELLHISVSTRANPDLPVWFLEGIVSWLNGERVPPSQATPLDRDLRQRSDRRRAELAYHAAQARVSGLISTYGEPTVLAWVSAGLPDEVKKSSTSAAVTNKR